jgi:hypothetical protein
VNAARRWLSPLPGGGLWRLARRLPEPLARPIYAAAAARRIAEAHGVAVDLRRPRLLSEYIAARMLRPAHPLLTRLADKIAMREHVAGRIGAEHVLPLLGVWERAEQVPWDALPERVAVKCNHGCAMNVLRRSAAGFDAAAATDSLRRWLREDFARIHGEFYYSPIPRRVFAEPLLSGPDGLSPPDHKVLCLAGRAAYLLRSEGASRTARSTAVTWYDPQLRLFPHARDPAPHLPLDPRARALFPLAERVAEGLEIARVDFYLPPGRILVGEVTIASGAGGMRSLLPEGNRLVGEELARDLARARAEGRRLV